MWGYAYPGGMAWWMVVIDVLTAVLVVAAVVALVVFAARYTAKSRALESDPQRVLAQRFARGEIDEEEYRSRVATLSSPAGPASAG